MAKLIYSLDGAFLGEFPIEKERMLIGRRPGNDIHIDNLAISGEHAAIFTVGNDTFLEDLGSTNGTLVNGQVIGKHKLQHGDLIELGKYQLKFINESVLQGMMGVSPVDYEKTMIIRPAAAQAALQVEPPRAAESVPELPIQEPPAPEPVTPVQPAVLPSWARAPAAAVPAQDALVKDAPVQESPLARVQVLNGPSAGKELVLSKVLTTMGKPGVQVAVLTRRPHGYFVTHVEGLHHPMVNGNSVGVQAHQLSDHDIIEIAGVKMEFYFVEA